MTARTRVRLLAAAATGGAFALTAAGIASAAPALQPFGIAGAPADGGFPGSSGVIDLQLTNPNDAELTLTALTVSIQSITQAVGAVGPCTVADFEIAQLPVTADVVLPPNSGSTLSGLGVAAADLPRFAMLNSSLNQDGCKAATVTLLYTATATAPEVGGVDQPPLEVPGTGTGTGGGTPVDDGGTTDPTDVGGVDLPGTGALHTNQLFALGAGLVVLGAGTVVRFRRRTGL